MNDVLRVGTPRRNGTQLALRGCRPHNAPMRRLRSGGGWPAIRYSLKKSREVGGLRRLYRALKSRNACKTCALGMGGQKGGMVTEGGRRFEVCKKSIQAMAADMQGGINENFFHDLSLADMRGMSPRELEHAGRLTAPVYKGPLDSGYRVISWDEALKKIATKMGSTAPEEAFFYLSGRSSNEAAFLLQLFARVYGSNHVNNCSFYCHQASGVGLSSVTGSGTATIVLEDLAQCDLLFLVGANPSSNHPRFMKTIVEMKRRGGHVIVINPLKELGLTRFKVPSDVRSMLWGSRIADTYIQPHIGGDIALLTGIARCLVENNGVDESYIRHYTSGWEDMLSQVMATEWKDIEDGSGVSRDRIAEVAATYMASTRTIFCWAMGITHHAHGVHNVRAIANLALMRGMLGRPGRGLLPLRGHSNVQGIGSVGVTPRLKDAIFRSLERELHVTIPTHEGLDTMGCIRHSHAGKMRFAFCLGGNLHGSNPDSTHATEAMSRIDMVLYLSTTLNTGHAWGTGRETIILPVSARDEESQATTQESMFNYVRFSDGGRKRHPATRSEVEIIVGLAGDVCGSSSPIHWEEMLQHDSIRDAIARTIPGYERINAPGAPGDPGVEFQVDERTFHAPSFPTPDTRARFHVVPLPPAPTGNGTDLRLMTLRSEGQFNTVVYEEEDIYRGQERRDVILMNPADIARLGFEVDQQVTVHGAAGSLPGIRVRPIDVREGNAVMYYPEANVLADLTVDEESKTPAFKHIPITLEA